VNAAATLLAVAWFLLAFVVRTVQQVRRTGDTGLRLQREHGAVALVAKVLFPLALVLVAPVGVYAALGISEPVAALSHPAVQWSGFVLAVVGVGATYLAQLHLGESWRIGVDASERTELVVRGVYRRIRNPIFTAMGVSAVGLVLVVPSPVGLAGLALLVAALEVQVRGVEEPYLRATHGASYRRYEQTAGRFLPGLGLAR
jgi:protein-S-isoprenylcysteine O-methyltransferase Ste14